MIVLYAVTHVSVFNHFVIRHNSRRWFVHSISRALGTTILVLALWNADSNAKIVGVLLAVLGLGVALWFKLARRSLDQSGI